MTSLPAARARPFDEPPVCRNCRWAESQSVDTTSFDDIWDAYERLFRVTLPDHLRATHTPYDRTALYECRRCLVQFFWPAIPGDASFYEEITSAPAIPYVRDRWEFFEVINDLHSDMVVLDVGAGPGWFLELARNRGCEVIAVDHNPSAIDELSAKGIRSFSSLKQVQLGSRVADVVTAFHMVEHVADVISFIADVKQVLRPEGSFYISVPNRARIGREAFEPLDFPPHHLTRWSVAALRMFGDIHELQLGSIKLEPPDRGVVQAAVRNPAYRVLNAITPEAVAWFTARVVGLVVTRSPIYGAFTRLGGLRRFDLWGHSMLGHYYNV